MVFDAFSRKADDVAPEETKVDTEASQGSNREELNKKLRLNILVR